MKVIGLRDNICVKDSKTTCGSKMLENFVSPFEATVVEKLNNADVKIEKIDIFEFGIEEDEYISKAFEKGNIDAIVATDWDGEIARNSEGGIVGIKPTFGNVSRYGVVAIAPSLEQVSVIGKDLKSAKEVFDIIKGYDDRDSGAVDEKDIKKEENKKMKIGYIEEVKNISGEKVDIKNLKYVPATHYIISSAEASSNLGKFDGIRYGFRANDAKTWKEVYTKTRQEGFGYEAKKKQIAGTFFIDVDNMQEYYIKANKVRTVIKRELDELFKKVDVIAVPNKKEYACLANLTGRPAITVNGITFIGKHFDEENLIGLVSSYGGDK